MYRGEGYKHIFYFINTTQDSVLGSMNHWPRTDPALRARLYDFISRSISSARSLCLYTQVLMFEQSNVFSISFCFKFLGNVIYHTCACLMTVDCIYHKLIMTSMITLHRCGLMLRPKSFTLQALAGEVQSAWPASIDFTITI